MQNKKSSNIFSNIPNRIKTSSLVFVLLVGVGSIGLLINSFSKNDQQNATVESVSLATQIPGWWYMEHFGLSVCEAENCKDDADPDFDQLTNIQEYYYSSNPLNNDTNSNGNTDGEDVALGYAPNKPGKITFDEALSDDNIVGESLLFGDEVKEVIESVSDVSKLVLPEINDLELNIIQDTSKEAFTKYMLDLDAIAVKYTPKGGITGYVGEAVQSRNPAVMEDLKALAAGMAVEYRKVKVPVSALKLHKYQISLWELVPSVLNVPDIGPDYSAANLYDTKTNSWYDSVQMMIVLNQKLELEVRDLRKNYDI